jgi:glycosyl transferase family 1
MQRDNEAGNARVLVFSHRLIHNHLFRCPQYELEDIICQIDDADILAPQPGKRFNFRYPLAKRFAWHTPIVLNPGVNETRLAHEYDLFFAACGSPVDLLTLSTVKNWKENCKVTVCLMDELWIKDLEPCKYLLKILSQFDFVMPYYSQGVNELAEITGCKVRFLPPGVDTTLFCPYPEAPERVIDVFSPGRRSSVTHQSLLKMASGQKAFYFHDTIIGDRAINAKEHRALFANIAKRSRFFVVNPGSVEDPRRGKQSEMAYRYFEASSAGAVLIGERPRNDEFDKLFDWPDAVIRVPYGSDNIEATIRELDSQPERLERIRRCNVTQALKRHDWVHRWETVLECVGLRPTPKLLERKERLRKLAEHLG